MKILPETPSVDFLRQEAKDLLVAMRESDPAVTLTRAQRALAELYGFATWQELRSEVERQRAQERVVAPELGAALASAFELGRPAGPMSHLAWSPTSARWALDTDSGRFMIRTILDYITEESVEGSLRLRNAAIASGIRAPQAVRSKNGKLIEEIADKHWSVDAWMDVGPTPNVPVSSTVATNAGITLARLHNLALPTSAPITPWLTARRNADQWSSILDTAQSAGAPWASLLEDALPWIGDLTAICVDAPRDEVMLCINEIGPASVRLAKDDEIAVVFWDFAGANAPSWELGGLLNSWSISHDGSVNEITVHALLAGYRSTAETMPDLDLSIFSPSICGHLNWTAGRISRALDDHDPDRQRLEMLELRDLFTHPRRREQYEQILAIASE